MRFPRVGPTVRGGVACVFRPLGPPVAVWAGLYGGVPGGACRARLATSWAASGHATDESHALVDRRVARHSVIGPADEPDDAPGLVDLVPGEAEDLILAPAGVVGEVEDVLPRGGQVGADGEVFGVFEEALAGGILPQAVGEAGHGVEPAPVDGEGAHAVEGRGLAIDGAGGRPGGARSTWSTRIGGSGGCRRRPAASGRSGWRTSRTSARPRPASCRGATGCKRKKYSRIWPAHSMTSLPCVR